jgi:hypothetical protein
MTDTSKIDGEKYTRSLMYFLLVNKMESNLLFNPMLFPERRVKKELYTAVQRDGSGRN